MKFKMELTWHNCLECPPEECTNDYLIATDGTDVFEAAWYAPDGFMIHAQHGWHGIYEDLDKWYWADIRQTVRGDGRFKSLSVDIVIENSEKCNTYTSTFDELSKSLIRDNFSNEACVNCPSNPKNGGTGICFCTLGQQQITC